MDNLEKKEYIQAGIPDYSKLGELINRAKGPNRTMAAFAQECGIGPSTLSRIANGRITKPVTIENLSTIYEHKDEMFQASFEVLASANGLVTKEEYDKIQARNNVKERKSQQINRERAMQSIITTALLDRNLTIARCPDERIFDPDEKMLTRARPSLSLYITGDASVNESLPEGVWNLFFYTAVVVNDPERFTLMSDTRWVTMRVLEKAMRLFIKDAWYTEKLKNIRTSFVFCDEAIYNEFLTQVKGAPITSAFTAMLVDVDTMRIVKDTWISQHEETKGPLSLPVVGGEEYDRSCVFNSGLMEDDE